MTSDQVIRAHDLRGILGIPSECEKFIPAQLAKMDQELAFWDEEIEREWNEATA